MQAYPPKKRYYPLWWLLLAVSRLPFPLLYLLSDFLCLILYRFIGYRKKVVRLNLQRSFPEKTAAEIVSIIPAFYQNFCDVIVETLKLATVTKAEMRRRTSMPDSEQFAHAASAGPVIILGSHQANWEWALSASSVQYSFQIDGVYKVLNNEFFEWFMLRTRTRFGQHLVNMKDTLKDMIRRKNILRAISMLSDQTPPRGEIQYWTTFLNQDTAFYVGADKLAATFKYPVFFVECVRVKRGFYEYRISQLWDGKTAFENEAFPITERYARRLEKSIQENPAAYLWSHKRWKHAKPAASEMAAVQ
ncbi:lysophospholipid acyltransferase family protein [Adhaeribacter terreus]|uniref:Lysophospholipid acyltransferase family protein n=1 Tax=Adhaeribacter terreus TaxID=529703 RepID=A0ABW0E8T2_9BACT